MRQKTTGQRVEELSHDMGGRFKLTSLIQKRIRDYYVTGRAFMPKVDNLDELFELVLDQIEHGEIRLRLPEEAPPTFKNMPEEETADEETVSSADETLESVDDEDSEESDSTSQED